MGNRPVFPLRGVLNAAVLAIGLAATSPANASTPLLPLPLFNTGVDESGALREGGKSDISPLPRAPIRPIPVPMRS
jgi:hypothetical protein